MEQSYREIDVLKTYCLSSTLNFTRYFFKQRFNRKFIVGDHHRLIASALDKVLRGEITRLIINIFPRSGKTELAVKHFIAMGLAINPRAKFIHLSYSDDLALDNSADVQAIMQEPEYKKLFTARATSKNSKKWYTEQGGGLYAVSSAGQVTGFGAGLVDIPDDEKEDIDEFMPLVDGSFGGAIIIDDPIKPDDALSHVVRDKVNNKFDTTIRNRVNSRKTPIIIIMQRLHEQDLCGFLEKKEGDEWTVLSLPIIYEENGERHSLWSFKFTLEELDKLRAKNPFVFDTQYMQKPKPLEGLMYEQGFKEYEIRPVTKYCVRKSYTDTADTGKDFLCSIVYDETEIGNFIVDVLFTQKPMEYTEPATARMFCKHDVQKAIIESNNGGRGFARNVENMCRSLGNTKTSFKWFAQTKNKEVRIFNRSADVQNLCYMPKGWQTLFPEFASQVLGYMKIGNNDHDDGPDCLSGIVEQRQSAYDTISQEDYEDMLY